MYGGAAAALLGLVLGCQPQAADQVPSAEAGQSRPAAQLGAESTGTVPFTMVRGQIIVDAEVAGRTDVHFILDTGVDPSVIDRTLAEELGIEVGTETGEASGAGEGPGLEVASADLEGLRLGARAFGDVEALAADLSSFSEVLELELGGILGYSLIADRVLRIDYRAQEVALAESAEDLPPLTSPVSERHTISLEFNSEEDRIPVFPIRVGGVEVPVSLDTGKSGGIELFAEAMGRLALEDVFIAEAEEDRLGARGSRSVLAGELREVGLGPFRIEAVPASTSDRTAEGERREGNAGNAFLRHFVLTVDYMNGTLTFAR